VLALAGHAERVADGPRQGKKELSGQAAAEHLVKNGNTSLSHGKTATSEDEALLREEAELTARLEAIRERRGANPA
jgi:hypothetical protein